MRLRQVVLVARSLHPLSGQIQRIFDLGSAYRDPGVGEFGLENDVHAVGDTFLEVVAPLEEGTAAGRFLDRFGAGGYMVIVQVSDIVKTRRRIRKLGLRVVWSSDLDTISGTHIHPKDLGGAILSLDQARPPESWHWAGPSWEQQIARTSRVSSIAGVILQSPSPRRLAERWAEVLERQPASLEQGAGYRIVCGGKDDGVIDFVACADGDIEGVVGFWLKAVDPDAVLEGAQAEGLECAESMFCLGGARFCLN